MFVAKVERIIGDRNMRRRDARIGLSRARRSRVAHRVIILPFAGVGADADAIRFQDFSPGSVPALGR